jgi:hypothetical protein
MKSGEFLKFVVGSLFVAVAIVWYGATYQSASTWLKILQWITIWIAIEVKFYVRD